MPLVTPTTLRLHFGREFDTSTEDENYYAALEAQAVAMISTRCGWDLGTVAEVTDYHNGSGTNSLPLRGVPNLSEDFTLEIRSGQTWTEIPAAEYQVLIEANGARGRVLYLTSGFSPGELNYRVTFTRGFTATTCPLLLQRAILDRVQLLYRQRTTATPTALGEATAEATKAVELLPSEKAWIDASAVHPEPIFLPPLSRS